MIVGTGALALPKAFQTAGWLLGTILLLISGFVRLVYLKLKKYLLRYTCFSYICATFVVEAMSVTNAALKSHEQVENRIHTVEDDQETGICI